MIPNTVAAVVAFLLLVAPGVAFQLLRAGTRPETEHTSFREVSLVGLTSLFFSGFSVTALALVRAVWPAWMPDLRAWFTDPTPYVDEHYRLIARAALMEFLIALALAVLMHRLLESRSVVPVRRRLTHALFGRNKSIVSTSAWHQVFGSRQTHENVYVTVETTTGRVYAGSVVSYSVDAGNPAEREIVLGPPFRLNGDDEMNEPNGWQRVIVPGSQVSAILAGYVDKSLTE